MKYLDETSIKIVEQIVSSGKYEIETDIDRWGYLEFIIISSDTRCNWKYYSTTGRIVWGDKEYLLPYFNKAQILRNVVRHFLYAKEEAKKETKKLSLIDEIIKTATFLDTHFDFDEDTEFDNCCYSILSKSEELKKILLKEDGRKEDK